MANATDDEDLCANELDALRISRLSGPTDSTVSEAAPAPLQVPGEQDTSPKSETSEPSASSSQQHQQDNGKYTILCDMAYGIPREARPRKEKIRAIARQLVNFLSWQHHSSLLSHTTTTKLDTTTTTTNALEEESSFHPLPLQPAQVIIVGCTDAAIEQSLKDRMLELWVQEEEEEQAAATATGGNSARKCPSVINLPNNLTFTQQSLESFLATTHTEGNRTGDDHDDHQQAIYLSPDASVALDPASGQPPPSMVVVGLLIDRTHVQVNCSLKRAQALSIPAARWPLENIVLVEDDSKNMSSSSSTFVSTTDSCDDKKKKKSAATTNTRITLHASEPLNCDCILEGMQQWYWNYDKYVYHQTQEACHHHGDSDHGDDKKKKAAREACFSDAVLQALQHHVQRHPGRPIHKT